MATFEYDKVNKDFIQLTETSFGEQKLKERYDLQEAIEKHPSAVFGEDLLVIGKEFDKFSGVDMRVDLLAIDSNANLVVIELKRDDSGKHEHLQALDYATIFSTWTTEDIIKVYQEYLDKQVLGQNALAKIAEFLEIDEPEVEINTTTDTSRIFIVATNFQQNIKNSVLCLNRYNNFRISCFEGKLLKKGDALIYDIEMIIPSKNAEDYYIKMKSKEEKHIACERNRIKNPEVMNDVFNYFHDNGMKTVPLTCVTTKRSADPRFKQFNPAEIGRRPDHYELERHSHDPNRFDVAFHLESGVDPALKAEMTKVLEPMIDDKDFFSTHMGGISVGRISTDGKTAEQIIAEVEAAFKKLYDIVEPLRKKFTT